MNANCAQFATAMAKRMSFIRSKASVEFLLLFLCLQPSKNAHGFNVLMIIGKPFKLVNSCTRCPKKLVRFTTNKNFRYFVKMSLMTDFVRIASFR